MKKSITFALVAVSFLLLSSFSEKLNETIIGTWVNPPTYERNGKMLGFKFSENSKCEAVGIASLELEKWRIEGQNLIIEGTHIDEDGTRSTYLSVKPIIILNKDTLQVLDKVKGRAKYTYINTKHLEELEKAGKLTKGKE